VYSQIKRHSPDGYRQDCSGYVSLCWAIPAPGENTVTLVTEGWMREIPVAELRMGDAVGKCGPNTGGNDGHIQWVESYRPGQLIIWEQAGGGVLGPRRRILTGLRAGYRAYRFRDMITGDMGGTNMLCKLGDTGPIVAALQHLILRSGGSLPQFGADSDYGQETASGLAALVGGDGKVYGPAQWAALFVKNAQANAPTPALGIHHHAVGPPLPGL
jgi:hypothetical protein